MVPKGANGIAVDVELALDWVAAGFVNLHQIESARRVSLA
jgi:hypothetical protein